LTFLVNAQPMAALQGIRLFGPTKVPESPVCFIEDRLFDDADSTRDFPQRVFPSDAQWSECNNSNFHNAASVADPLRARHHITRNAWERSQWGPEVISVDRERSGGQAF